MCAVALAPPRRCRRAQRDGNPKSANAASGWLDWFGYAS